MKRKQLKSAVLALLAVVFVLTSSALIVIHSDHECTGEDCPVCMLISVCSELLRGFGTVALISALAAVTAIFRVRLVSEARKRCGFDSLVALKVKLSN